jgi:RNA polymerase sigma-70 factor (ECF subfamily)
VIKISLPDKNERWAKLMEAAQDGDSGSYNILLKEISVPLRKYLQNRIDVASSVEDVLQESLFSIHKARHSFDPNKLFSPWMYAIARYRLIDYFRHHSRIIEKEVKDERILENIVNPGDGYEEYNAFGSLNKALAELPDKQRKIIKLLKFHGLTVKEAALEIGISEGALKVAAHRAYKSLRKKLEMEYEN